MLDETLPQDPAAALDSLDAVAGFLAGAFDTGRPGDIADALRTVAHAPGMAALAAAVRVNREDLRHALDTGELSLDLTLAIMKVIDLHLPARPAG